MQHLIDELGHNTLPVCSYRVIIKGCRRFNVAYRHHLLLLHRIVDSTSCLYVNFQQYKGSNTLTVIKPTSIDILVSGRRLLVHTVATFNIYMVEDSKMG